MVKFAMKATIHFILECCLWNAPAITGSALDGRWTYTFDCIQAYLQERALIWCCVWIRTWYEAPVRNSKITISIIITLRIVVIYL